MIQEQQVAERQPGSPEGTPKRYALGVRAEREEKGSRAITKQEARPFVLKRSSKVVSDLGLQSLRQLAFEARED